MRLALTFDDGPSAWTEGILDLLAAHGGHATFFVIGSVVRERRNVLERIVAEGHELGNHTWSHPWLARDCDDAQVEEEFRRTNEVLTEIVGYPPRRFRAPHYDVDERVEHIASRVGLVHTRGDVTPPDWRPGLRGAVIATLVLQQANPDVIVGLHDGIPPGGSGAGTSRQSTVDAMAIILPRLLERGLECETASTVMG